MMSIAASFPSVKKPRFNVDLEEERQRRLKVMLVQRGTCTHTDKYFAPNLR
jgi:hypothetical protein